MAALRNKQSVTLKIKMDNGKNEKREQKTLMRTFSHFSAELPDEDFLRIGNALGALQAYPVLGISRAETADLMEA